MTKHDPNLHLPEPAPATFEDMLTCARTIWGEARGEPDLGQVAVAWVIRNRAAAAAARRVRTGRSHPLYGDGSLASACRRPWQFSCWNEGDPNRARMLRVGFSDLRFCHAMSVACRVQGLTGADPVDGATHYHNHLVSPAWARGVIPVAKIGDHLFYNNIT